MSSVVESSVVEIGREVLKKEALAISDLSEKIGPEFQEAAELIFSCKGKLIVSGIGKSGHIGRKISSTFSSTGTPSVFLHPAESIHGDLGVVSSGDVILVISYGGESPELFPLLDYAVRRSLPVIVMTGRPESRLGQIGKVLLSISVKEEACPLRLAPTTSSTVTLALGDALAMAVLKLRGFKEEDFAVFHPGGSLGRKLLTRVQDLMHKGDGLPLVTADEPISRVVGIMTAKEVRGIAGVVDSGGSLIGVITDGAIRRRLERSNEPFTEKAVDLMTPNPKTIDQNELAQKALFLMEQFKINVLFAIDKNSENSHRPVGVIHVQDLLSVR